MKPVNSKSLFSIICETIDLVGEDKISLEKANTISKLTKEASSLLSYELKRAAFMTNSDFAQSHRNIEIKHFDCLTEKKTIAYDNNLND